MHRPLKIGLTGGIGSGKSEALSAFRRAGADTISVDELAHELSRKGGRVYRAILAEFGPRVLAADGTIDRRVLGERVFKSARLRRRLEAAAHPPIVSAMRKRLRAASGAVVVVDAPLLFEAGLQKDFDVTVLVSAGRERRIRRVARRDGLRRGAVLRRMQAQLSPALKERMADVVLRNDGSLARLRRTVVEYQQAFRLMATARRQVRGKSLC